MFRVNGKPAIGIGIAMRDGGNILRLGKSWHEAIGAELTANFPIGIEPISSPTSRRSWSRRSTSSPRRCGRPSSSCWRQLPQPGRQGRAGRGALASRWCSPSSSSVMSFMGIGLQRISLGALIIALGLLVDDAMITVEMMVRKIEEGVEQGTGRDLRLYLHRLSHADGNAGHGRRLPADRLRAQRGGQYCFSLFAVIADRAARLMVRGRHVLAADRRLRSCRSPRPITQSEPGPIMRVFRRVLELGACGMRWIHASCVTLALFGLSLYGMRPRPAAVLPGVRPARAAGRP